MRLLLTSHYEGKTGINAKTSPIHFTVSVSGKVTSRGSCKQIKWLSEPHACLPLWYQIATDVHYSLPNHFPHRPLAQCCIYPFWHRSPNKSFCITVFPGRVNAALRQHFTLKSTLKSSFKYVSNSQSLLKLCASWNEGKINIFQRKHKQSVQNGRTPWFAKI